MSPAGIKVSIVVLLFLAAANGQSFRGSAPATTDITEDTLISPGAYTIKNLNSRLYLNVLGNSSHNGANVVVWDNPDHLETQWIIHHASGMVYLLQSASTGKYLNVDANGFISTLNKTDNVRTWDATDSPSNLWAIGLVSNGVYTFRSLSYEHNMYMNVLADSARVGANVEVAPYNLARSHWQILPAPATTATTMTTDTTVATLPMTMTDTTITTTTETTTTKQAYCKTCNELGWTDRINPEPKAMSYPDGIMGVCGQSPSVCNGKGTHSEAMTYCASMGARLCTKEEMLNCEGAMRGCGYDGQQMWTSTPCDGGFFAIRATHSCENPSATCTTSNSAYFGRCCADVTCNAP